ncbi:hypothetical protein AW27_023565 [Streptomyces sp. PCS3-D2]|uniref:hypothetical protein n=1 Tax=Streptomyces sp. PCS3-D2 TaxID=1460244 RepID=UPI000A88E6BC|nr:hypothetical protein [Streptomyces sp. PCS3-D2]WKV74223.1 hypothetical protein AW27_023565 [Streptomyces sp. PCS3-D2]
MTTPDPRPPLPPEPRECIAHAVRNAETGSTGHATAWALIAIATELGAIRRELRKGR